MLVLTRKTDEPIVIGDDVEIVVLSIRGNRVRLGIRAPKSRTILRGPIDQSTMVESRLRQVHDDLHCL